MKVLRTYFITGLLIVFPVLATIDIFRWVIRVVENSERGILPTALLPFDFPGLGFLIALSLILLAGMAAQNYLGRWLVDVLDHAIKKISVVGGIYGGIKKFLQTILGQKKDDRFQGVVLVPFPREGVYSIGFRTGAPDPKLHLNKEEGWVNIFVPCTPNPTSGFYLLVKEKDLRPLSLSVQEAFKIVISLGLVSSEDQTIVIAGKTA